MTRMIARLGLLAAALAALAGIGATPATAAPVAPASVGFTCTFDIGVGSGVVVDICLERTYAPGLQVRAITWVENRSSQFLQTQIVSSVQGKGGTLCGLKLQAPNTTRACQSNLFWDFDGDNDRAVANLLWVRPGQGGQATVVQSPVG